VVTDMRMPDLDGAALYREIVARHPLLQGSFVFLTGDTFSADTHGFVAQTGAVLLSKPCTFDEVEDALKRVLGNRQPPGGG